MALKWIYTINSEKKPQSKIELWFLAPIATAFSDLEKQGFFLAIVFSYREKSVLTLRERDEPLVLFEIRVGFIVF